MKPSWDDAPEWAKHLAMDENGRWYWFKGEPWADSCTWNSDEEYEDADYESPGWRESLESRPE